MGMGMLTDPFEMTQGNHGVLHCWSSRSRHLVECTVRWAFGIGGAVGPTG